VETVDPKATSNEQIEKYFNLEICHKSPQQIELKKKMSTMKRESCSKNVCITCIHRVTQNQSSICNPWCVGFYQLFTSPQQCNKKILQNLMVWLIKSEIITMFIHVYYASNIQISQSSFSCPNLIQIEEILNL